MTCFVSSGHLELRSSCSLVHSWFLGEHTVLFYHENRNMELKTLLFRQEKAKKQMWKTLFTSRLGGLNVIICKVHIILPSAWKCQVNRDVPIVTGNYFFFKNKVHSKFLLSKTWGYEVRSDTQTEVEMANVTIVTGSHSINIQVVTNSPCYFIWAVSLVSQVYSKTAIIFLLFFTVVGVV